MTLAYAGIPFEVREVVLKDKPLCMLQYSPKGTVPVLILGDGTIKDESLDIISWALSHHDPDSWLDSPDSGGESGDLIEQNDGFFKTHLDRYKYGARDLESPPEVSRNLAEVFLKRLESRLQIHPFLHGEHLRLTDIAIFPFVRQFANVDMDWFLNSPYEHLRTWLQFHLDSLLFQRVMEKYPQWKKGCPPLVFGHK